MPAVSYERGLGSAPHGTSSCKGSLQLFLRLDQSCPGGNHTVSKSEVGVLRIGSVNGPESLDRSFHLNLNILLCRAEIMLPIVRDYVEC